MAILIGAFSLNYRQGSDTAMRRTSTTQGCVTTPGVSHPRYHKDMRKRIAEHEAAILSNKELFTKFFNTQTWVSMRPMNGKRTKGCYVTKKVFTPNQEMMILGEVLKDHFDYGPRTNSLDILFHFKRLYDKLEIEQPTKQ